MSELNIGDRIKRFDGDEIYVVTSPGMATRTFVITQADLGKWHLRGLFDRIDSCSVLRRGDVLTHRYPHKDREVFVVVTYHDYVMVAEIIEYRNPAYWVVVRENN